MKSLRVALERLFRILLIVLLMFSLYVGVQAFVRHINAESELGSLLDDRAVITQEVEEVGESDADADGSPTFDSEEVDVSVLHNEDITEDQQVMEIKKGTQVLEIPSLGMVVPIVEGTTKEDLKVGAGHFEGTGVLGVSGNYCLAGHSSSMFTCVFNGLDSIELYSEVHLYDEAGNMYAYYVTDMNTISPQSMYVLSDYGDTRVTLITCADGGKLRFSVTAIKMTKEELAEYKKLANADRIQDMKILTDGVSNIQIVSFLDSRTGVSGIYRSFAKSAFPSNSSESGLWSRDKLNKIIGVEVSEYVRGFNE